MGLGAIRKLTYNADGTVTQSTPARYKVARVPLGYVVVDSGVDFVNEYLGASSATDTTTLATLKSQAAARAVTLNGGGGTTEPPPEEPPPVEGGRDIFHWPGAWNSWANLVVRDQAIYSGGGSAETTAIQSPGSALNAGNFSHPMYKASSSDPTWTVWDRPNGPFTGNWGNQVATIKAPNGMQASGVGATGWHYDKHLHVLQPDGFTLFEMFSADEIDSGSKRISVTHYAWFDLRGDMRDTPSTRACGFSSAAGLIRLHDLQRGAIDHVLAISMPNCRMKLGPIYPALSQDGHATNGDCSECQSSPNASGTRYCGVIPMGARLAIPRSVNINNLGLSAGGLILARAAQRFGCIVADGAKTIAFYAEPTCEGTTLLAQMRADKSIIKNQLRMIMNTSQTTPAGPGNPIAQVTIPRHQFEEQTEPPPPDPEGWPTLTQMGVQNYTTNQTREAIRYVGTYAQGHVVQVNATGTSNFTFCKFDGTDGGLPFFGADRINFTDCEFHNCGGGGDDSLTFNGHGIYVRRGIWRRVKIYSIQDPGDAAWAIHAYGSSAITVDLDIDFLEDHTDGMRAVFGGTSGMQIVGLHINHMVKDSGEVWFGYSPDGDHPADIVVENSDFDGIAIRGNFSGSITFINCTANTVDTSFATGNVNTSGIT